MVSLFREAERRCIKELLQLVCLRYCHAQRRTGQWEIKSQQGSSTKRPERRWRAFTLRCGAESSLSVYIHPGCAYWVLQHAVQREGATTCA